LSVSNGTRMVQDLGSSRSDDVLDAMLVRDSAAPII
jgi:hypothetical protein